MRSEAKPHSIASSQPFSCQSSWPRSMRVGIDAEPTSEIGGESQESRRRIEAFRPRVDLDRLVVRGAGGKDAVGIEYRFRSSTTHDNASRAVSDNIDIAV